MSSCYCLFISKTSQHVRTVFPTHHTNDFKIFVKRVCNTLASCINFVWLEFSCQKILYYYNRSYHSYWSKTNKTLDSNHRIPDMNLISIEQVSYNINYICLRYTPLVLMELRFYGTKYEIKLLLDFYTVQNIQYQICTRNV